MYTLDANVFVREVDPRDPDYAVCHDLIQRLQQANLPILIPLITLAEIAGAVSRSYNNPMRARMYTDILRDYTNVSFIVLDESLASDAADIAADYALKGMDAIYAAVARRYNCTLVSLDEDLRQRTISIVTTRTPTQALDELSLPTNR